TLTLSGGSAGTGAVAQWFEGSCGSTVIGTGNSITVSPSSTTTYFVRYNGTCNTTTCASQTVTVNTLSVAPTGITGTSTICNGNSTTLTLSGGSAGTGAVAQWFEGSCGSTVIGTGNSITVSPSSTTTYFVRYNGTCNTTTCASQTVTVNTLSVAPTGITGISTICAGGNTTLTLSGGSLGTGAVWRWYTGSCGGTLVGSGTSILVSPGSTTTYFVRAEGTCNTTTCASQTVTVNTLSVAPTGITGTSTICNGNSTTLTLSGGSAGTGAVAQWFSGSCGGTLVGTGNSITVSPGSTTTYFVRYSGTCNTTTCASQTVTVNPIPAAFTANQVTVLPLCFRGSARIEVPSSQSGISYQLIDGTNPVGFIQTGNGSTLVFHTENLTADNANYYVWASTPLGCTSQVNIPLITVENTLSTLSNDGDNRTCYLFRNNNFVEFRSANGHIVAVNPGNEDLGYVTALSYVEPPVSIQACGTYQPWFQSAALGRHWTIEPENQPAGNVQVRLYYNNSEYLTLQTSANSNANPDDDVSSHADLDLSKYSNPGNPSVVDGDDINNCGTGGFTTLHQQTANGLASAVVGTLPGTARYVTYSIPSFSEFWLGATNDVNPLPIVLQSFTAECDNGMVKLNWITASEINNEIFLIDRSPNLVEWEEVTTVAGAGNSNAPLSYTAVDDRPLNGLSYYRLTQRDYDGTTESFDPISIICYADGEGNSMLVFPNPAEDKFTVSVNMAVAINNAELEISDINGKRIMIRNVNLEKGTTDFTFDRANMNPGTYFIQLRSNKLVLNPIKLIVK
ncbi:MAG: T9SS type A sorting domain-containing protein, partial [Flavobacteriales bacterium]|nr:T9SS type A sorting domain-containing protein [Flavobacteriales bacterium]